MPTFTGKRLLRGEEANPQIKSELEKLLTTPKALSYLKPTENTTTEYEYNLKGAIKIDKQIEKEEEEEEDPPGLDG
jgi:hypothetical protein